MTGSNAGDWRSRLARLGVSLPTVVAPIGAYVPAVRTGSLVYTSGQVPFVNGRPVMTGKVGANIGVEQAAEAARICALNALAAVHDLVGLDAVVHIVKVVGFVASAPDFTDQPVVINGASELLEAVFGEAGKHARSAVGVAELPGGVPVEVELIADIRESTVD